tara:strand:+ start:3970 stop:5484 length:1515 start_codon:yes stop_codon:yes gene_type:complete
MQEIFNEWRKFVLLTEISFEQAVDRMENSKVLRSFIKNRAWDPESRTLKLSKNEIEYKADLIAKALLHMVPDDLDDNQRGTALEWILSRGLKDKEIADTLWDPKVSDSLGITRHYLELYFQWHRFMEKKDIFTIHTLDDLLNVYAEAEPKIKAYQAEKKYMDAEEGTEVFRDDEEWKIYAIHNKGAACELGKGTEWCTAAPGLDYFEQYYEEEDPLFYFEHKESGSRYQFHFGSEQFMDEDDWSVESEQATKLVDMLIATGAAEKYDVINDWKKRERAENSTDPEELKQLAKESLLQASIAIDDDGVLTNIAGNQNTPSSVLYDLIVHYHGSNPTQIWRNIATNPSAEEGIHMTLADVDEGDEDGTVRHTLGARTKYPKVLARLASMPFASEDGERDSHWSLQEYIRSAVAKNENTPPETLDKLGSLSSEEDANGWIRMAIARNLETPYKTLEKLSKLAGDNRPKGKFRVGDSPEKIAAVAEKHMELQRIGAGTPPSMYPISRW